MRSMRSVVTLDLDPARAAEITALAAAAKAGGADARNRLFAELAAPIRRLADRLARFHRDLEPDEMTSESFLALADLIDRWDGVAPFDRAVEERYDRCLARRLAALRWPGRGVRPLPPWDLPAPDPEAAFGQALAEWTGRLTPAERRLLLARVGGAAPGRLAAEMGISRRTLERRWAALVAALRPEAPATPRRQLGDRA
jgi:hypothetical protein